MLVSHHVFTTTAATEYYDYDYDYCYCIGIGLRVIKNEAAHSSYLLQPWSLSPTLPPWIRKPSRSLH